MYTLHVISLKFTGNPCKFWNVQNFVGFLEDGKTWKFAFDIYWPLDKAIYGYHGLVFQSSLSISRKDLNAK